MLIISQTLYGLYLLLFPLIFFQPLLSNYTAIVLAFSPFPFTLVQWDNHSRTLVLRNYTTLKGHVTQLPDPVNYQLNPTFFTSLVISSLAVAFPFLSFPTLNPASFLLIGFSYLPFSSFILLQLSAFPPFTLPISFQTT